MKSLHICLVLTLLYCRVSAQDTENPHSHIDKESVLSQLTRDENKLRLDFVEHARLREKSYEKQLESLRATAAQKLDVLKEKVRADDLDEAVKLRDLARSLTQKPKAAPGASQTANERINELLVQVSDLSKEIETLRSPLKQIIGSWSGQFANGFKLQLSITADGNCVITTRPVSNDSSRVPIQVVAGRLLVMREGHSMIREHLELLKSGDRLVALGWGAVPSNRRFETGVPNISAILTRVGEPSDEPKSR